MNGSLFCASHAELLQTLLRLCRPGALTPVRLLQRVCDLSDISMSTLAFSTDMKRCAPYFPLHNSREKLVLSQLVRWCNGSTTPFGGVCHGSNPCRTAIPPAKFGVHPLGVPHRSNPPRRLAPPALTDRLRTLVNTFLQRGVPPVQTAKPFQRFTCSTRKTLCSTPPLE